jgi:hypothetical protein
VKISVASTAATICVELACAAPLHATDAAHAALNERTAAHAALSDHAAAHAALIEQTATHATRIDPTAAHAERIDHATKFDPERRADHETSNNTDIDRATALADWSPFDHPTLFAHAPRPDHPTILARAPRLDRATTLAFAPHTTRASPRTTLVSQVQDAPRIIGVEPGDNLRVFLMTMGPGDQVWERFGHNALWVYDAETGEDVAYNYGVFSFDQPGFVRRFVLGRMLYWMVPEDAERMVRAYAYYNRSVWIQELNLTPRQRLEMKEFLEWNALPQNRAYLYDYFRDNCSTRVRDVIDRVLGGELRASLERVATGTTYRSHSLRLTHDDLPVYTGLLLAMGRPVDRPLDAWQESFIPMQLSEHVANVQITGDDGVARPLVIGSTTLFTATRAAPPAVAPRRTFGYLVAGLVIAALILLLGRRALGVVPFTLRSPRADDVSDNAPRSLYELRRDAVRRRRASVAFGAVAIAWSVLIGLFGAIITFLWAVTDHAATYANENVLLANPLLLVLAAAIGIGVRRAATARQLAFWLAAALAALALVAMLLKLLPGFDQANGPLLALLVPPHLATFFALYPWRSVRMSESGDTSAAAPLETTR